MDRADDWTQEEMLGFYGDTGFDSQTDRLRAELGHYIRQRIYDTVHVRDAATVADIESATRARVLVRKHLFVPGEAMSWVGIIAEREAITWLRKKSAHPEKALDALVSGTATSTLPDAFAKASAREQVDCLYEAILTLPASEQMALLLAQTGNPRASAEDEDQEGQDEADGPDKRKVGGMGLLSQKESAQLLGWTSSDIHRRLKRSLARLYRMLAPTNEENA